MPERDHYLPGVPCWVDTSQPDPEGSLDFYGRLFGWEFENVMPAGTPGQYFMARVRGGEPRLSDEHDAWEWVPIAELANRELVPVVARFMVDYARRMGAQGGQPADAD